MSKLTVKQSCSSVVQPGAFQHVHVQLQHKADLTVLAAVWWLLNAAVGLQGGWLTLATPALPEQCPVHRPQQLAHPAQHA